MLHHVRTHPEWVSTKDGMGTLDRSASTPRSSLPSSDIRTIFADYSSQEIEKVLGRLQSRGEHEVAFEIATSEFSRWAESPGFLRRFRAVATQVGSLSEASLATYLLHRQKASSAHTVRHVEGKVRELSRWIPSITAPAKRVTPSHPQRVLHLVKESRPYFSNGFTSRSHYNFLAEKAAGLDPVVMTEPGSCHWEGSPATNRIERFEGIAHHHLGVPDLDMGQVPPDMYLSLFADLAYAQIHQIRPAVIHASSGRRGYETALVAAALARHTGLPFVYEVRSFFEANWTADTTREAQGEVFDKRMAREAMLMHEADLVLTIGEAMRDEIADRGVPRDRIGVIPNGVDEAAFRPQSRDAQLAAQYGVTGLPTYGYVSNMDHPREGQETLIHALAHLAAQGREVRCVLVGDGPRRPALEELSAALGVQDRVVFTGRADHADIARYYSLIDIFVVPRVRERAATYVTPLKPFEAMAMRIPVVTSDLPALREIVSPPDRGLTFAPGDAEELASVLVQLEDDPERREAIAEAGHVWVHQERTWRQNGDRYRRHFHDVVASEGS